MAWLLDTNVLSELRRPRPEPKVVAFVAERPLGQLYISVITLAEFHFGIELVAEPNRRAELNDWLTHKVRPMFDRRVLQITEGIILQWRLLVEEGRKSGHTFSQPDLLIAATAIHHGLTVATRDRSDYDKACPRRQSMERILVQAGEFGLKRANHIRTSKSRKQPRRVLRHPKWPVVSAPSFFAWRQVEMGNEIAACWRVH
jgi:predicted nucleic acid-binding protein